MPAELVYVSDELYDRHFTARAARANVVCAGDSITGWNNFGRRHTWPFPTYPEFLQLLCQPLGLVIADGGIAGEVSDNGPRLIDRYLSLFPQARYFVIGFGTNDLAIVRDLEGISQRILDNYDAMLQAVRRAARVPILLNVPDANASRFAAASVVELGRRRDFHNNRLGEFCAARGVPLVDIRSCLQDEHLGDELHPNQRGARAIAQQVFVTLRGVHASDDFGRE